uniref:Toxin 40 n=1 Tax=Cupiennius salei TaxID=6928 RepID=A0A4Y5UGR2_CUPSA|nr:toxin 40 precursor [Cupiennius salei]
MIKYILISALFISAVYSFTVEEDEALMPEAAEEEIIPEEARKSLPDGEECDGNKDDCQCYGKWHKCSCPYFWPWRSGKCYCEKGWKHTCITKLSCPNKDEWGLEWRNEEAERSPC